MDIDKSDNSISIAAIVSGKEAEYFKKNKLKHFSSNYFEIILHKGEDGSYDSIGAHTKKQLSNSFLDNLRVNEKKELINEITEYLHKIKRLKDACCEE